MINDLYRELTTAIMCEDCPAAMAWLDAKFAEPEYAAARRAAAHWQAADEKLQIAIGTWLGFCEPTGERCPLPAAIAKDYSMALDWAGEWLQPDL